jgi:hypothetical protein
MLDASILGPYCDVCRFTPARGQPCCCGVDLAQFRPLPPVHAPELSAEEIAAEDAAREERWRMADHGFGRESRFDDVEVDRG